MKITGDPGIHPKKLTIPEQWKVIMNNFVDLEPDNSYPIDEVFGHFDEDILMASYKDWFIDLGFYGGYLTNNRSGWFKIEISRGDWGEKEFFEHFISRSTEKIKDKLNLYFVAIPNGQLDSMKGISYDQSYASDSHHIYSAMDKVDYRISTAELLEIGRAKDI
jgi:hypothetical protein